MGDGAGAETGFIGEDAPGHALFQTDEQGADQSAGEGAGVESTLKNHAEHMGDRFHIQQNHADGKHNVEQRHKGHQLFRHLTDAVDAAQQHHGHHQGNDNANHHPHDRSLVGVDEVEASQRRVDGGDNGVDLGGVAGAEDRQHAKQGIERGQPFPFGAETVFNVVHGAADVFALGVFLPEVNGKYYLGKFGTHSQKRGTPHPEHRARAANGDGTGYTGDVAGAHCTGQCRTHRLEGTDGAILGCFLLKNTAKSVVHGGSEFSHLNGAGADGEPKTCTDDANHGGQTPNKIIQSGVYVNNPI